MMRTFYGNICEVEAFIARMTIDAVWEMIFYVRRQREYLFGMCELGFAGAENLQTLRGCPMRVWE
jgi:hypothetical protein